MQGSRVRHHNRSTIASSVTKRFRDGAIAHKVNCFPKGCSPTIGNMKTRAQMNTSPRCGDTSLPSTCMSAISLPRVVVKYEVVGESSSR